MELSGSKSVHPPRCNDTIALQIFINWPGIASFCQRVGLFVTALHMYRSTFLLILNAQKHVPMTVGFNVVAIVTETSVKGYSIFHILVVS